MTCEEYEILKITPEITDVFLIRLKPKGGKHIAHFKPGQFYHIKNPTYVKPNETRQFSIITTPKTKEYVEFCIKTYGPWTKALIEKEPGESVCLFGPMGQFTHHHRTKYTVFIAGGVGITPIISIIQSLHEKNKGTPLTLIYANKSSQTILKKTHIENVFQANPAWKLISLVSQMDSIPSNHHHGRITEKLLKEEVDLHKNPLFFICGSKRFTGNIITLLHNMGILNNRIKQEVFLPPYPTKTN